MKDFFVSYNGVDRRWAEWIAWELEEAGYTVVFQAWDFQPGSNFVLEMDRAAKEADRVVAVLSNDYLASRYAASEWAVAFQHDPTGEGRKLVPVRVRECDVNGLLGAVVYIDLVGLEEEDARIALIKGLGRERAKPTMPPRFPIAAHRSLTERPLFPKLFPNADPERIREIEQDPSLGQADKLSLATLVEFSDINDKIVPLLNEHTGVVLEIGALLEQKMKLKAERRPAISWYFLDQKMEESKRRLDALEVQIEKLRKQERLSIKKMKMVVDAQGKAMTDL